MTETFLSLPFECFGGDKGLLYAENDTLFESTGMNGASSIQKVTLQTGKVKAIHRMSYSDFWEGLTLLDDRLIQVTWRQSTCYIYDRHNSHLFLSSHGQNMGHIVQLLLLLPQYFTFFNQIMLIEFY